MNEQAQIELIEFLSDVFGLLQNEPIQQRALQIENTLNKLDEQSKNALMQEIAPTILAVIDKKILRRGEEYKAKVGEIQKKLGISNSPLTAKLGGVLNYINKLNTVR